MYFNCSVPHFTAPACERCSGAAGAPLELHFPGCVYLPCPQSFWSAALSSFHFFHIYSHKVNVNYMLKAQQL